MVLIRSKAPFRISYGGGGTDMAPYCIENGGCVISTGIDRYVYITIKPWTDESHFSSNIQEEVLKGYEFEKKSYMEAMQDLKNVVHSMKKIIESKNLTILNDFGILIGKNYKLN